LRPPELGGALEVQCNACHRPSELASFRPGWLHPTRPVADHLHCTDCHPALPHDAAHPLPRPRGDYKAQACYACHRQTEVEQHWPSHHGAETTCRGCHPAHEPFQAQLPLGLLPGDVRARWSSAFDWYQSNQLCLRCHTEASLLLPLDRGFVVLNTANYHDLHIEAGRCLCTECHAPHGSTRPALLRPQLVDGNVFSYRPQANGGTCAVLCHGVDHRDWAYTNRVQ
jgi:predicted CXXCH cytochrome family protein